MGVKNCFRKGCDNIPCDRLSSTHGYICSECFDELVESGVKTDITEFMNSPKPKSNVWEKSPFTVFDCEFPYK